MSLRFSTSKLVPDRSFATTPDVWFALTDDAVKPNGRFESFGSYCLSKPLSAPRITLKEKEKWSARFAMFREMHCSAGNSTLCNPSINGWSTNAFLMNFLKELRTPKERFLLEKPMMLGLDGRPRFM